MRNFTRRKANTTGVIATVILSVDQAFGPCLQSVLSAPPDQVEAVPMRPVGTGSVDSRRGSNALGGHFRTCIYMNGPMPLPEVIQRCGTAHKGRYAVRSQSSACAPMRVPVGVRDSLAAIELDLASCEAYLRTRTGERELLHRSILVGDCGGNVYVQR